jgi:hypothetical protein
VENGKKAASASKRRKILIIYAGEQPDKATIQSLLTDAGCPPDGIVMATTSEVADGEINPKEFDHVISLLDDELAKDASAEASALAVAQCGGAVIGVWSEGVKSAEGLHPAVGKYGRAQVPWDPKSIADVLGTECPQPLHTPSGEQVSSHPITQNKC